MDLSSRLIVRYVIPRCWAGKNEISSLSDQTEPIPNIHHQNVHSIIHDDGAVEPMHLVGQLSRPPIPPERFLVLARLVAAGVVPIATRVKHETFPQDVVHQYQPAPLQNAIVRD
jgi:hypothetical protein